MKYEVKILLYPDLHKSKNGAFFERLIRTVFSHEGYDLQQNINFTGLEIDLIGKRKNRNEQIIVECKAKKKPLANEVKAFVYNVLFDDDTKSDHGYFVYTEQLDHGGAGIKSKIENDNEKSKKMTFLGPDKIINILSDLGIIKKFEKGLIKEQRNIQQVTLAYTYFGIYYVVTTFKGTENQLFHVFDATNLNSVSDLKNYTDGESISVNIITALKDQGAVIDDVSHLEIYNFNGSLFSEGNSYLSFSTGFQDFLYGMADGFIHSQVDTVSLDQVFVKPNLRNIDEEVEMSKSVFTTTSIDSLINSEHHQMVVGDNTSGKTSLCKYAIRTLFDNNKLPIYLNGDSIPANLRQDRLSALVAEAYGNQYVSTTLIDSVNIDDIVIVIDDFHLAAGGKSDKWETVLSNIDEKFAKIIVFSDETITLKVGALDSNSMPTYGRFNVYRILELGPKLRYELIKKWHTIGIDEYSNKNEILHKIDHSKIHINSIIGKSFIPSYPFYILSALQALEAGYTNQNNYSVYGFYYELLIKNSLSQNIIESGQYNLYINYLSNFAYLLFEIGEKRIDIIDFREFHEKFCDKVDFNFSVRNAMQVLDNANIVKIYSTSIGFKQKYIYYYFIAQYLSKSLSKKSSTDGDLSREEAEAIIIKLIQRVYRDEFASIIMFLTHVSKDEFIISNLVKNAKLIFHELDAVNLKDDVEKINNLIDEIPSQVIDALDVEKTREDNIEDEDSKYEKRVSASDDDNLPGMPNLDEDVFDIDYFSRLTLSFKTIQILGQIAKAYWGEMAGQEKEDIVLETYELGLRALKSYYIGLTTHTDELTEHLTEIIAERNIKNRYFRKDKVESDIKRFIFKISFLSTWGTITRIASSVGTKNLKQTYSNLVEVNDTISYRLINLAITLHTSPKIPFSEIEELKTLIQRNKIAFVCLQNLIINHLHLYESSRTDRTKISQLLNISIKQQLITSKTSKSKRKK